MRMNGWAVVAVGCVLLMAVQAGAYEVGHVTRDWYDAERDISVGVEVYYPGTEAGNNVPVAIPPEGGFPAIAFGHGYLIPWSDYSYIWEELVPEGYILLMATGRSGLFPDHEQFGLDLAFLVDEIFERSMDPESGWYEKISTKSAVMGHSMGGGASVLAASYNPEIDAVINLAAAETNPSAIQAASSVDVPMMLLAGWNDCVTPLEDHQLPMYGALASGTRALINLDGATHCQFCNYNFTCELGEFSCPDPEISREEQHARVIEFSLPFLNYFLYDELAAWAEYREQVETGVGFDYAFETDVPLFLIDVRANEEPVLIPSDGGEVEFTFELASSRGAMTMGSAWLTIQMPNGNVIGPLGFQSLTLPPYFTIEPMAGSQDIPGPAPDGQYEFRVQAGRYPNLIVAQDTLVVIKGDE